jgi:tRNA-dihydrouridine synthase B
MEGRPARELPSAADRLRFALVHYRTMVDELGESRAVPQMRKHLALYLKGIVGAAALRERIMRTDTAAETVGVIDETISRLECASPVAA